MRFAPEPLNEVAVRIPATFTLSPQTVNLAVQPVAIERQQSPKLILVFD